MVQSEPTTATNASDDHLHGQTYCIWHICKQCGMLVGNIAEYSVACFAGNPPSVLPWTGLAAEDDDDPGNHDAEDVGAVSGPRSDTDIRLA